MNENGEVVRLNSYGQNSLDPHLKYSQTTAYPLNTSSLVKGETYKVCLIESIDNGKTWRLCKGHETVYVMVEGGGKATAADYKLSAQLIVPKFESKATVKIRFENTGSTEYYDLFYFITNTVNENPRLYNYASGITVEPNNYNDIEFVYKPKSDTVYYWLLDVHGDEISTGMFFKGQTFEDFPPFDEQIEDSDKDGDTTGDEPIGDDPVETNVKDIELESAFSVQGNIVTIKMQQTKLVSIYSLNGSCIFQRKLTAGTTTSVILNSGIYVCEGKVICIR